MYYILIASVDLSGFELVAATVFYNNPTSLFVKKLESNTTGTSPVVSLWRLIMKKLAHKMLMV